MPFGHDCEFPDFQSCVDKMREEGNDQESARRICGALQRDTEEQCRRRSVRNRLAGVGLRLAETADIWRKLTRRRRVDIKATHVRQVEETEREVIQALTPFFNRQFRDAIRKLKDLGETPARDPQFLTEQIFDPQEHDAALIDTVFPVLARGSERAAIATFRSVGLNPDERAYPGYVKASTATQWLQSSGTELPPGLSTEIPFWMRESIAGHLRTTFEQPYWKRINQTTANDIQGFLRTGLQEGESVRTMANRMNQAFPESYSRKRGVLVARTESGNALNGARKASIDQLGKEVPEANVRSSWLSVLGVTTRDDHANADGQIANDEGLFNLAGYMVPWPAYHSLPPEQRCNCQCTVTTEFLSGADSAEEEDRVELMPGTLVPERPRRPRSLEDRINRNDNLNRVANDLQSSRFAEEITRLEQQANNIRDSELSPLMRAIDENADQLNAGQIDPGEFARRLRRLGKQKAEIETRIVNLGKDKSQARTKYAEEVKGVIGVSEESRLTVRTREADARVNVGGQQTIGVTSPDYDKTLDKAVDFTRSVSGKESGLDTVSFQYHQLPRDGRAFHVSGNTQRSGVFLSNEDSTSTFVHEIGHRLEDEIPSAQRLSREFRDMRVRRAGTRDQRMKDLDPGAGYGDDEIGNEDDWKEVFGSSAGYVGKTYQRGSTEILSMGMEELHRDPLGFSQKDPEYFKFVIGVLRGEL